MHVNLPTRIHRASSIKMIKMQKCFIFFIVLFFYCFLVFSPLLFFLASEWSTVAFQDKSSRASTYLSWAGRDTVLLHPTCSVSGKTTVWLQRHTALWFLHMCRCWRLVCFFLFSFSFFLFFTSNLLASRTLCGVVTPISPLVGINLWPISLRLFSSPESHCCRKLVAKVAASTLEKAEFSRDRQAW